jgi:arginase family enzyme
MTVQARYVHTNLIAQDWKKLVEFLPQYDPAQITALLVANIAYEFISLVALSKKNLVEAK